MSEKAVRQIVWRSLVVLTLVLASRPAAAATQVGVIAGPNFSNLRIDGASDLNVRSTFAVGGVVDLGINDRWGIRIEPTYLSKGTKAQHRNAYWGTMDGAIFKLNYVDLPLLARIDLASSPKRGYLLAGVSVGFLTSADVELSQAGVNETADFSDVFKSTDLTLDLGAGVGVPAGAGRLTFDGRAAIGLANINDGGTVTFQGAPLDVPATSTKTLDFRLFATYLFPVRGK